MKQLFAIAIALFSMQKAVSQDFVRNVQNWSANIPAQVSTIGPLAGTACNPKPVIGDCLNTSYEEHIYTLSEAANLKIPVVNAAGSKDLKIYVKDYKRVAPACASSDGSQLTYGIIIRTVIEIENYDASLGVNVAAFAASASLNKSTQHFYFYKDGFTNGDVDTEIAKVSGKNFNVENYYNFQQVMTNVLELLKKPQTVFSPVVILNLPPSQLWQLTIKRSLWSAYALQSIKNKTPFAGASGGGMAGNLQAIAAISEIYDYFGVPKDNTPPSQIQSLQASQMLDNFTIKW
ncbi:MAG TPA: hypothetical protein VG737_14340 [Cyclobacteriaceae bacterium]|nr:hypothetical protein [Cyclobacteriaceae bacterium]